VSLPTPRHGKDVSVIDCWLTMERLLRKAQTDPCTTGLSTIGDEKKWNVFMRLDTAEVK
jgi:hypothetical protein